MMASQETIEVEGRLVGLERDERRGTLHRAVVSQAHMPGGIGMIIRRKEKRPATEVERCFWRSNKRSSGALSRRRPQCSLEFGDWGSSQPQATRK
jgi:hypothetical protein